MTDTEAKALALVNEACKSDFKDLGATYRNNILGALLLAIERLEATEARHAAELREQAERFDAFRQEVSEACKKWTKANVNCRESHDLDRFILPAPDPLEDVLSEAGYAVLPDNLERVHAALAARGYEVRKIGEAGE